MQLDRCDLLEIERAAVRGWPALQTAVIDGWLARSSSGGSVRANSVSALDYAGQDILRSIDDVVAFYRGRKATPRFTITDVSMPAGLDSSLEARGWRRSGDHVTMAKDITKVAAESRPEVELLTAPTTEWFDIYLEGLSGNRRGIAPKLVERVPEPRQFFLVRRNGEAVGSGLSVLDGAVASVQCMATWPAARRTGAASAILAAIETYAATNGVRRLYLQTDAENVAAVGLYKRFGFATAGHYHTRELVS